MYQNTLHLQLKAGYPQELSSYCEQVVPLTNSAFFSSQALRVFCGQSYSLKVQFVRNMLELGNGDLKIECLINDDPVACELALWSKDGHELELNFIHPTHLFDQSMGFVFFTLNFISSTHDTFKESYKTPLFSVFMRDGEEKRNICAMIGFVSQNSSYLLNNNIKGFLEHGKNEATAQNNTYKKSSFLDEVVAIYRNELPFFRTKSRFSMTTRMELLPIERLSKVTSSTLTYIVTHPDELTTVNFNSGISTHGHSYMPRRTLVETQARTNLCYENQLVLSFLGLLSRNFDDICNALQPDPKALCSLYEKVGNYVFSGSEILTSKLVDMLPVDDRLRLKQEIQYLYQNYRQIFDDLQEIPLKELPHPTQTLVRIPEYRRIYALILNYFHRRYLVSNPLDFLCESLKRDLWYEYYCLFKLCDLLVQLGCTCKGSRFVNWNYEDPFAKDTGKKNSKFDNVFTFIKDKRKVELFYQPVIKSSSVTEGSGLHLYRSSSWVQTFSGQLGNERYRKDSLVYTPDYVLKIENPEGNSLYLIIDAKYSDLETVISARLMPILFKYSVGIGRTRKNDRRGAIILLSGRYTGDLERPLHENINPENPEFIDNSGTVICRLREVKMTDSMLHELSETLNNSLNF